MISVSALCSYLYCQRKLYLQYVLGFFEPMKEATIKGSIRHKIHEEINKIEKEIVISIKEKISLENIQDIYKKHHSEIARNVIRNNKNRLAKFEIDPSDLFKQIWPLILEESTTRADSLFDFMQLHLIYGQELWEKLTPKIKTEYRIESKELGLRGIIDQLEVYEKGLVPIELKTGSCPKEGVWPNHKVQIAAYALLLEKELNTEIKEGFITYLDTKQKRHIPMNAFLKQEILDLIGKVNSLLRSKEIPLFEKNENKCAKCGIKNICYDKKILEKKMNQINH